MANQILRSGDALENEWVDLLVEYRDAGHLMCFGEALFGILEVGLRRVVLPDPRERCGGVEAVCNQCHCGRDDYSGACAGGVEPARPFAVGCAETDRSE